MLGKFFDKVKQGLARTREAMTDAIAGNSRLDDDAIDDIEAALIGADMGIETATELVDELRERLRRGQMADGPSGVMQVLEGASSRDDDSRQWRGLAPFRRVAGQAVLSC